MKWISVKERLPERYEDVLIYFKDDSTMSYLRDCNKHEDQGKCRCKLKWHAYAEDSFFYKVDRVTHWMELPKAPE